MKIVVEKIVLADSNLIVHFLTDYGKATALWEGDNPTINGEYHVEMDFENTLIWNKDIVKDETEKYSIQMHDNMIFLVGILDSVDDDGYTVVKFGDNIVPFVTNGVPFEIGSFIKLIIKTVTLTQINYL